MFLSSRPVQKQSIALVRGIDLLLCTMSLWRQSWEELASSVLEDVCGLIDGSIHKLGSQVALFLQVSQCFDMKFIKIGEDHETTINTFFLNTVKYVHPFVHLQTINET